MAHTVSNLMTTSVEDCKSTVALYTDDKLPLLRELLAECFQRGHKTRSTLVIARIMQLVRKGAPLTYNDGECSPEYGDQVTVYSAEFEPEAAKVVKVGKDKICICYDNECIKPRREWISPAVCDLIAREG